MAYAPVLGGAGVAQFPRQFDDSHVDSISMAVTAIELLSNNAERRVLSHATGFFWRSDAGIHLITARHVLSGLDPFTDGPISKDAFFPEQIRVFPSFIDGQTWTRSDGFVQSLRDEKGSKLWLQDPEFASLRTDIAALPFEIQPPEGQSIVCVNDGLTDEKIVTQVGFDCSIVGYPTALLSGLRTPVWRRGTIASEPYLPVDGKPMFLVDASTSPGFSGSPVFRRHVGAAPIRQTDGTINILADRILTTTIIGVYAGRLQHTHFGGEVPFVFYANRIPSIVKKPNISFNSADSWTALTLR